MLYGIVWVVVGGIALCAGTIVAIYGADRFGVLLGGAAAVPVVAVPVLLTWFGLTAFIRQDGPFTGVQCRLDQSAGSWMITISAEGFDAHGCVEANVTQATFVNSDDRISFHLCVGRNGTCLADAKIPDVLRGGVVLEPGETRTVTFPPRSLWYAVERSYPLTLAGAERPANGDLVVRTRYFQGQEE